MTVVVVGGGIVGLASAHYLAERAPDREVLVVERSRPGAGSTGRAVGGIRAQFSTRVNVRLSLAALEVWSTFESEFGVDIEHRRNGYLFLARDPDTAARLEETVEMQRSEGVPARVLSPAEATEHAAIDPANFERAAYSPEDGVADPHLALQGFSKAAREGGVELWTGATVTDLDGPAAGADPGGADPAGDRWTVTVEDGDGTTRLGATHVVNAAGPWARRVGRMAGLELPVAPRRRQVAVVAPERPVPEDVPLTADVDQGSYFLPDREGDALVGGHFREADPDADPDRYDTDADTDWSVRAVERAADYADYFGPETGLKNGWAGLYAVTPDHHPIIEESVPGLVTAVGFSGHGFMHAPATGQCVAELVVDGAAETVDVSGLSRERFGEGGPEEHNVL